MYKNAKFGTAQRITALMANSEHGPPLEIGDVPNHVPGVVPIMFRGLCQALCSVMRRGQLSGLTFVNETSLTFRGGMKEEEIATC